MASVYKVLGQANPAATTLVSLYSVPAATSAVISTIAICNLGPVAVTYRIAVRPGGIALANLHYLAYEASLLPNTTQTLTLGLTLAASDVISVYASSNLVAFAAFGSEVS